MKRLVASLTLLLLLSQAHAQVSSISRFIKRMYFDKDSTRKSSFEVLPILTSAPETGFETGGAGLYSFYTDTARANRSKVSDIYPYVSVTTKGHCHFSITTSYWSPKNLANYTGAISYINYPFNFYGIGNNTRKADKEVANEKRFKLNLGANWLVAKNLNVGLVGGGYDYRYKNIDLSNGHYSGEPPIEDIFGGAGILVGPSLLFDSRDNNTYSTRGAIITAYYNAMHGIASNNGYIGGFLNIEYSQFFSLSKKLVLGIDIQEQSQTNDHTPNNKIPALGSD